MKLHFYKYQGTGNDFIMADNRDDLFPVNDHALVAKLCDRRFGIGADGLILLQSSGDADFYMKYYNSDGNESSMCGNGGRCIAAFAQHLGVVKDRSSFIAVDGRHDAVISGGDNEWYVKLKMQDVPEVTRREQDTFVLDTGSPHFVRFLSEDISRLDLVNLAKAIRYGDEFKANGINVNMVNLSGPGTISMRTYERGVEDETLSCGTGVTAAALSTALLNDLPDGGHTVNVKVQGGMLTVTFYYNKKEASFSEIWLEGPAAFVYEGHVDIG